MTDSLSQRVGALADRWLSRSGQLFLPIWLLLLGISVVSGWRVRDQHFISAESGLGYWLGIMGGSLMLLLLTYSLRKRLRILRRFLSMKSWLQFHMTLGILGPLLILFHSNFQLGSLNSTVALVCMLLVAGSGFVGRYLYSRIHYGLYGEKIRLQQVEKDFQELRGSLLQITASPDDRTALNDLFDAIDSLTGHFRAGNRVRSTRAARKLARETSRDLDQLLPRLTAGIRGKPDAGAGSERLVEDLVKCFRVLLAALKKLPGLQRYERLFALWHVVHIPVFGLMVITAITHVITVHMY